MNTRKKSTECLNQKLETTMPKGLKFSLFQSKETMIQFYYDFYITMCAI